MNVRQSAKRSDLHKRCLATWPGKRFTLLRTLAGEPDRCAVQERTVAALPAQGLALPPGQPEDGACRSQSPGTERTPQEALKARESDA